MPEPLYRNTSRRYPGFNMNIPDQYRAAAFIREIEEKYAQPGLDLPQFIFVHLPNDHMADARPESGYPYEASFVVDNDYALGRILEYLSGTKWWREMAVFITEDDAQGGVDHVDAHRSILLVASPWVKPGAVSHLHTSMGSITRTIDELLGLGALNLEDALAGEVADIFDSQPHLEPFAAQSSDARVFDPAKARFARPKNRQEAAALHDIDDAEEIRKELEKSGDKLRSPRNDD
jgi:hypothetical protein